MHYSLLTGRGGSNAACTNATAVFFTCGSSSALPRPSTNPFLTLSAAFCTPSSSRVHWPSSCCLSHHRSAVARHVGSRMTAPRRNRESVARFWSDCAIALACWMVLRGSSGTLEGKQWMTMGRKRKNT